MTYNNVKKIDLLDTLTDISQHCEADKEYQIDFNEQNKKRSLNANSYFWQLCHKISEKIDETPTMIYQTLIKSIDKTHIELLVNVDDVDALQRVWEGKGLGWMLEIKETNIVTNLDIVLLYFGSSAYNAEQMSKLIDKTVKICKKYGVETMNETELNNLKSLWETERKQ